MIEHLKQYGKTHLFYIIIFAVAFTGFRIWLSEHDARLAADKTVELKQKDIAVLQMQMDSIKAQAQVKTQVVQKIVAEAKTPQQQIEAIPQLSDVPLDTREVPGLPDQVDVNLPALVHQLGQCQQDKIARNACEQTASLKDQQLADKDVEIVALKKKPRFLKRVLSVAKAVGIGVGIGLLLGGHL